MLLVAACGPSFVEPTGTVVEPALRDGVLVARDAMPLPLHRWEPEGAPSAVVLALHSFGDFGGAFEELGPWLADAGILVVAYDQRGFGATEPQGRWWGTEPMVDDARDALRLLRAAYPNLPLALVGESMGGAVAILAAARSDDVDRLVLAAPAVRGNLPFRRIWDLGFATAATVAPGFGTTVDHVRPQLSDAARRRLADDPRVVRRVRVDTYWGLLRLANAASAVLPATLPPTLLVFGTDDETVPAVSLCTLAAGLDAESAVRIYEGAGHRLLHEPAARALWRAIRDWLRTDLATDTAALALFCADT